jgi:hypothetical protein
MTRPLIAACCALAVLPFAASAEAAGVQISKRVGCDASRPSVRVIADDVRSITFFVDGRREQKGPAATFHLPRLDRHRAAHFVGVLVRFNDAPRQEAYVKVPACRSA